MASELRTVTLAIQNDTNLDWTITGATVLSGEWVKGEEPNVGGQLPKQSGQKWGSGATGAQQSATATIRLQSVEGSTTIFWDRPAVGKFAHSISDVPGLVYSESVIQTDPQKPIWVLNILTENAARAKFDTIGKIGKK